MTYLQLINAVLVRLREEEINAIGSDPYITMIGALVNDAKAQVEEAFNWQALRTEETITTSASDNTYSLTDWGQRVAIEQIHDTTNEAIIRPATIRWIRDQDLYATPAEQAPTKWAIDGLDSNGDAQLRLYPTPDAAYTVKVYGWKKQADLAEANDVLLVPPRPVIYLAVALAARERGEVGGQTALELFAQAKRELSDAIGWDNALDWTALDWSVE
jgi:hypothetical protein